MTTSQGDKQKKVEHLWEVEHPYYCEEANYFGYGGDRSDKWNDKHNSWGEFINRYGNTDMDMNLVFRWDWEAKQFTDDLKPVWSKDPYYKDGTLTIYWMMQRKGYHRTTTIDVCRADEVEIKKWLKPRLEHLLKLWKPL